MILWNKALYLLNISILVLPPCAFNQQASLLFNVFKYKNTLLCFTFLNVKYKFVFSYSMYYLCCSFIYSRNSHLDSKKSV